MQYKLRVNFVKKTRKVSSFQVDFVKKERLALLQLKEG